MLSTDGRWVAFVRGTEGELVHTGLGDFEANEIRVIRVDASTERLLARGYEGHPDLQCEAGRMAGLSNPQFSPDGTEVFFYSECAAVTGFIHAAAMDTGNVRPVCPGGQLFEVVQDGEYAGDLIVEQHRYNSPGSGAYDSFYLMTPAGEEIAPLGDCGRCDGENALRRLLDVWAETPEGSRSGEPGD